MVLQKASSDGIDNILFYPADMQQKKSLVSTQ